MNEEEYIKSRMGRENPFRVPEGYFDNLAAEVMQKLPEQPSQRVSQRPRRWWMYAAACLVGVLLTTTAYFVAHDSVTVSQPVATVVPTESYVEEAADYVMADNSDIYACLTSDY